MGKYITASEYYPDDKDIYDFLDSQTRSSRPLLKFLRSRNILASKDAEKEELQNDISILFFDWQSAKRLVEIIDIRHTEQKTTHKNYDICASVEDIHAIAGLLKDDRHDRKREIYGFDKNSSEIDIHVDYIDIDTSKTILLQKKPKELQITVTQTTDGLSIRHTDSDRANEIVEELIDKLQKKTEQKSVTPKTIDISHLYDNSERVSFFKKTMDEIDGFRLNDVTNIKVDRLAKPQEEDDDTKDEIEEDLDEKVKKVVMYGKDLFTSGQFQELVEKGFFITAAQWKSEMIDSRGDLVEYYASFNKPSEGKDFAYKVLGVFRIDEKGNLKQTKEKVFGLERKQYLSALEASAHAALTSVNGDKDETT